VREAGLNRPLIRDAVRALAPWVGVGGPVTWSMLGRNESTIAAGNWRGTAVRALPAR
jgi:hypothetical protein